MRRIENYKDDAFEFHKSVIKSKNVRNGDLDHKVRVSSYNDMIEKTFKNYNKNFDSNSLATLNAETMTIKQKSDLYRLYDYRTKPFQKLNDILTTEEGTDRNSLCPFCTINAVDSLDHLLPHTEFAEFSCNPLNLMPSCTDCNRRKNDRWRDGNKVKYLNLYLDNIPTNQYLFVSLSIEKNTLKVVFNLTKPSVIDVDLWNRILNHYIDLKLCKRFSEHSYNVISELKATIESYDNKLSDKLAKDVLTTREDKLQTIFGNNYWKSILVKKCISDSIIYDFLKH